MSRGGFLPLVGLRLAVARGRFRRALAARGHPVGPLLELVVTAGSVLLLLVSAAAFAVVGTVLVATLARGGELPLAASAAGGAALVGLLLTVLTVMLTDAQGSGLDERPLQPLPIRPADRLAAELVGILFLEPAAAVIWPTSAIALLAAGQQSSLSALLTVPAASGQALLAATVAVLVRRLNDRPGGPRRLPWLLLAGLLAVLAGTALPPAAGAAWLPWHWTARALAGAWQADPRALAWGGLLHLAAFGVLALARTAPEALERAGRALRARLPGARRPGGGLRGSPDWRRVWGAPRARGLLRPPGPAAAGALILGWGVEVRAAGTLPLMPWFAAVASWVLAAGPAPLLANTLGVGGTAGVGSLHATGRPVRDLARDHLRLVAPGAAGVLVAAGIAASSGPWVFRGALPALALGLGMIAALSGTGAAISTLWPWTAPLDGPRAPLWMPSGARGVMAVVQGVVLTPLAVSAWFGFDRAVPGAFATLGVGLALGALGWVVASHRLDRCRGRILEALLS